MTVQPQRMHAASEQRARAIVDGAERDRAAGMEPSRRWIDSDTVADLLAIIDELREPR